MKKLAPFDAAEYLDNHEVIAEYLSAALEDENPDVLLAAIADVAKARGMTQLAKDTGLGRESLYKALAPARSLAMRPLSSSSGHWAWSCALLPLILEEFSRSRAGFACFSLCRNIGSVAARRMAVPAYSTELRGAV